MPVTRDITVIPNFVDLDMYRRKPDPALRARFCPSGERLVIHLSNLRPVKQVDAVVRVFAQIRARVPARLLIVGEGPELGRAEQLIDELGIGTQVELIGEAQDVVGLLSVSDLFLLPSLQESFGLSALEAMACGVPVVASNVGGLPEVVVDGVTGFLHPPDQVSQMAESAIRILSDPELHARMAAAGVRLATERFSADRIVPQYEALYEQTLIRS
jgi:N-acetyl-alpha-D-glucosaminyl L-malate synthase BshA